MSTINDRFVEVINTLYAGNKRAFSATVGINPSVLENVVGKRGGKPSYEVIEKVCANAHISPEWLITGRGEMIKSLKCSPSEIEGKTIVSEKQEDYNSIPTPKTTSPDGIPLIPVDAMAGAMRGEVSVMEYECERYVIPIFKGADFLIPVKGNSMYPKYSSGDIVACKRVPMTDLFFQWNKVYVLDTNQGALIKRIKPGSDTSRVLIVSENPAYDPFELPLEAIHAVALVMGVIRLE